MNAYDDNTLMPFGKHKDKKLANVPSGYLLWLHGELLKKSETKALNNMERSLRNYIDENMEVLKKEK